MIERQTGNKFGTITTQLGITFSSLHPYYTYVCTVYAVTVGAGPGAEPVSVTTFEDSKYSSVLWCEQAQTLLCMHSECTTIV